MKEHGSETFPNSAFTLRNNKNLIRFQTLEGRVPKKEKSRVRPARIPEEFVQCMAMLKEETRKPALRPMRKRVRRER